MDIDIGAARAARRNFSLRSSPISCERCHLQPSPGRSTSKPLQLGPRDQLRRPQPGQCQRTWWIYVDILYYYT